MEFANRTQVTSRGFGRVWKIMMEHDVLGIDPLLLPKMSNVHL